MSWSKRPARLGKVARPDRGLRASRRTVSAARGFGRPVCRQPIGRPSTAMPG